MHKTRHMEGVYEMPLTGSLSMLEFDSLLKGTSAVH